LLRSFRSAGTKLGLKVTTVGTDTTELSPALQLCDVRHVVRPVNQPGYLEEILGIVHKEKVRLLVPTVDLDLHLLALNQDRFSQLGCRVLISRPEVIDICQDKRKTCRFLQGLGFKTPATMSVRSALAEKHPTYPRFLKPWDGYAGRGNAIAKNRKELEFFGRRIPNCIVQNYIQGVEYTCDAFVDFDMKVRCIVPRMRIDVRAGEVSKSLVVKHEKIMDKTRLLVEQLGAGPGVITIQMIEDNDGQINFIEVNPRFGGGAPLSIKAGANFPRWILQGIVGKKPRIRFDGFRDNITMLRYDHEVWIEGGKSEAEK
jgi:carbamoyl-phosphate synthase large subunit